MPSADGKLFTLTAFPMYPGSSSNSGELIGATEAPLTAEGVLRFGEAIVDAARRVAAGEFDDRDEGRPDALDISLIGPFATQPPALSAEPVHPLTRLLNAASDHELSVLEEVAERAGLIWTCPVRSWTNLCGERCGECGRTEAEARAHVAVGEVVDSAAGAVRAGASVTIPMNARQPAAGTAQLMPVLAPEVEQTVWLVRPDRRAARHFGVEALAEEVIGGIVAVDGKWAVAAYRDRADLLRSGGLTYALPDARSRAHAARCLVRWWWWVARAVDDGADAHHLDPAALAGFDRRAVFS